MPKNVIADTSSLILFDKIDQLEILHEVHSTLYITPEIQ